MQDTSILAIDLAKNVFQIHRFDSSGKRTLRKRLYRSKLSAFVAQHPYCCIAMEDCRGANHWGRLFESYGHEVRLISPKEVKPYRRGNKTDSRDADALGEAASRPRTPYHGPKSMEAQDTQAIHRVREGYVKRRTEIANQIRGFLEEFGLTLPKGIQLIRHHLLELLDQQKDQLTEPLVALLKELHADFRQLDERVQYYTRALEKLAQRHEVCQRLMTIQGVGPLTATALLSVFQGPQQFQNGRHFAAYLGLTPEEHSSGEKQHWGSITKRGDPYVRKLLIQGSSAIVAQSAKQRPELSQWLERLKAGKGANCAKVALANRMARWVWAVYQQGEAFNPQKAWPQHHSKWTGANHSTAATARTEATA
jgi:transposase